MVEVVVVVVVVAVVVGIVVVVVGIVVVVVGIVVVVVGTFVAGANVGFCPMGPSVARRSCDEAAQNGGI